MLRGIINGRLQKVYDYGKYAQAYLISDDGTDHGQRHFITAFNNNIKRLEQLPAQSKIQVHDIVRTNDRSGVNKYGQSYKYTQTDEQMRYFINLESKQTREERAKRNNYDSVVVDMTGYRKQNNINTASQQNNAANQNTASQQNNSLKQNNNSKNQVDYKSADDFPF